jgi:hypothetical protein
MRRMNGAPFVLLMQVKSNGKSNCRSFDVAQDDTTGKDGWKSGGYPTSEHTDVGHPI